MESSRDSSIWRNLAVTFGGGLALGAVGMKLTQTLRPVDATPPRPEPADLTDRLSVMERRLERVEHKPAPAPAPAAAARPAAAPTPAPLAATPIDQKVLEAVIGAVDARLHEHAGQVDRRLADLEARLAVSNQQDRQTAEQLKQEAIALRSSMDQELRQVRETVVRTVTVQTAMHSEVQTLRQQNERFVEAADLRFEDMRREYSQQTADLRESVSQAFEAQAAAQEKRVTDLIGNMERSLEGRLVTAAATAAVDRVEEHLAPLRAEIRQKEQELIDLRKRLADSERSVLDVILAIGAVCRQAADRVGGPQQPPPAAPQPEEPVVMAVAPPEPEPEANEPTLHAVVEPKPVRSAPEFMNGAGRQGSNWRIPLVSAVLVSSGYLVLMHYLAAPLQ
jgi:hypothetical protein